MKKILFMISLYSIVLGCSDDKIVFDGEPNIYFPSDKTTYSWFGKIDKTTILEIPCNIVGQAPTEDKNYKMVVVADKTTAVEGVHYEKLPGTMTWEKGQFTINAPVKIFNNDPKLTDQDFILTIELQNSGDMNVNYEGNMQHTITMTSQVTKPVYWDQYTLNAFFGPYSKVKHSIIVQIAGKDFPASSKEYKVQAPYWQNIGLTEVRSYFLINTNIKDENGIIIAPW